jgi:single-strand DNA-binding protein
MSSGYNSATLLGRLASDPEELQTRAGKLFIKATIAVSIYQKSPDGRGGEEQTKFIPVTIFGRTAELFLQYVQTGDMVHLAGRLDSNEWKTDDGKKRLSLSFVVDSLSVLPNGRRASSDRPNKSSSAPRSAPATKERDWNREPQMREVDRDSDGNPLYVNF